VNRVRLLLVVAGVVVLALVVALAWAAMRGEDEPPLAMRPADEPAPGPVLLVPGYGGSVSSLERLASRLRAEGRDTVVVPLPGDGTGDLRGTAKALDEAADAAIASGAESVDVVGYSAGGLTARLWAAELGGADVARRVVTLGSPHAGTQTAALGLAFAATSCPEACQQMVPGSELLTGLEATPDGPEWTSIWTAVDEVVTPPDSARLDGATNIVLQDVCADSQATHGELPIDPAVTGLVLRALGDEPLEEAPPASECAALRDAGVG
jgi:triacylglycerol lipase